MPSETPSLVSSSRRHSARLSGLAFTLALSSLVPIAAGAQTPRSLSVDFQVQPLDRALEALGRQAGLRVVAAPGLLLGRMAPALKAVLTEQAAFRELLKGSGLEARIDGGVATILPVAGEAVLAEVRVKSNAERETAVTATRGYRPKRTLTGTKTDTPLSETPQAISVVTREQIEDQAAISVGDVLNYASGVRSNAYGVDSRGDWTRVRGTEPTQFMDGLLQVYGYNNNVRPDPYLLERVEVLRGPSSMLYGQGSTGGVINLQSKRPQSDRQAEIGLQLGTFNRRQVQGDATGALSEDGHWSYRVVGLARKSDTQVDFVPDNRYAIAPSLAWRPDANTSLTFLGYWQKDESGSSATFLPWSGTVLPNPNGQIPTSRFVSEPGYDDYTMRQASLGYAFEHRFSGAWTLRQNVRYAANRGNYQSLYPGSNFADPLHPYLDADQRIISRSIWANKRDGHALVADQSLEGSLKTGAVENRLLFGFDHLRYSENAASAFGFSPTFDLYHPVYGNFTAPSLTPNPSTELRQTGVYLQDQIKIASRFSILLGARRDHVTNASEGSPTDSDDATTLRGAFMFLSDSGWSPYLSYAESFQPVAGSNFYHQRYKPLRGEQWEAGVKFQSASGTTTFNAACYDLKEKNRQIPDPTQPLNNLQAGQTKSKGFEAELKTRLGRAFEVVANFDHIDLDEQLEGVPANQGSLWGRARFSLAGLDGWSAGVGLRHTSAFRNPGAPEVAQTTLLDAMLALDTGSWRWALNATNLTDKIYTATILSRGDAWYGARRNVVASLTYRF
ncbi:TonB-dependent siderophore receptor [Geothrix sp. PMB-07]|uniref:TonB-dependent siderophore receptor n=1 Tax=Geothrix sp. PMB-07 TaxID=3068640 RepID=UPI0027413F8F|nr:TonB-dependent siderophore receptor [Geothrix sp. PMB-07]WLT31093.1 TonB-dependent siderophore receptor [Geothrix sp. PMB-07]